MNRLQSLFNSLPGDSFTIHFMHWLPYCSHYYYDENVYLFFVILLLEDWLLCCCCCWCCRWCIAIMYYVSHWRLFSILLQGILDSNSIATCLNGFLFSSFFVFHSAANLFRFVFPTSLSDEALYSNSVSQSVLFIGLYNVTLCLWNVLKYKTIAVDRMKTVEIAVLFWNLYSLVSSKAKTRKQDRRHYSNGDGSGSSISGIVAQPSVDKINNK